MAPNGWGQATQLCARCPERGGKVGRRVEETFVLPTLTFLTTSSRFRPHLKRTAHREGQGTGPVKPQQSPASLPGWCYVRQRRLADEGISLARRLLLRWRHRPHPTRTGAFPFPGRVSGSHHHRHLRIVGSSESERRRCSRMPAPDRELEDPAQSLPLDRSDGFSVSSRAARLDRTTQPTRNSANPCRRPARQPIEANWSSTNGRLSTTDVVWSTSPTSTTSDAAPCSARVS